MLTRLIRNSIIHATLLAVSDGLTRANRMRVACRWLEGGLRVAWGCLSLGYQMALGSHWGGFARSLAGTISRLHCRTHRRCRLPQHQNPGQIRSEADGHGTRSLKSRLHLSVTSSPSAYLWAVGLARRARTRYLPHMSTQEILLEEIKRQPEPVLLKVWHYLRFLTRQREEEAWADVLPSRQVEQEVLDHLDSK